MYYFSLNSQNKVFSPIFPLLTQCTRNHTEHTGRHWASMGCLITILAVGVGPFVQQMSTVRNVRVPVDLPASIGRGQVYAEMTDTFFSDSPSASMIASIYRNIFHNSEAPNQQDSDSKMSYVSASLTCPSGECDFPIFRSLAVCSECYDFSGLIDSRCETNPPCLSHNRTQCIHSLPNGIHFNVTDNIGSIVVFLQTNSTPSTPECAGRLRLQNMEIAESLI